MEIEDTHISQMLNGHRETTDEDIIIATGIAEIDKQIEGFGMGELITLLGYPGDDKMNVALRIMSYQAVDNSVPSAYFCTRETPEIIARRLLCYRSSALPNRMLEYQIYIYFPHDAIRDDAVCKMKALACQLYIAIILMIDVIGTRYGIDGQQPCLHDLSWCQLDEYSDIVIGFFNCDDYGYVSEGGLNISGKMRIKVVKDRNNKQHEHFYLDYMGFILKQYAE